MRAVVLLTERSGLERLGGLPLWSRTIRNARQRGAGPIHLLVGTELRDLLPAGALDSERDRAEVVELAPGERPNGRTLLDLLPDPEDELLVLPADRAIDPRILEQLLRGLGDLAVVDSEPPADQEELLAPAPGFPGGRIVGPLRLGRSWLEGCSEPIEERIPTALADGSLAALDVATMPTYARNLRRHLRPYWFPAPTADQRDRARTLLLEATQKGALDIPAMFHAPIEKWVAWRVADTRLTPNQITVVTNLVAWSGTFLLATGRLGWGLVAALVVGVLDGVDGKLARLRLETSKLGELEHWFDFLYEWSWWAAIAHYLSSSGALPGAWRAFALLAVAEVVDGVAKWLNLRRWGCTIDEMSRFDRMVRWIGGRRNVYVWLLSAAFLFGRLPQAFALLPWLEGATAAIHLLRVGWLARKGGGPLAAGASKP